MPGSPELYQLIREHMLSKKRHIQPKLKTPLLYSIAIAGFSVLLSSCSERTVLHGEADDRSRHGGALATSLRASDTTSDAQNSTDHGADNVKIWFVREQGGELQPAAVERTLITHDPIKEATDQLLRGPTQTEAAAGLKSEIPLGTVILGVEKKGPITELNLSQRFASGGTSSVEARLSQLERTISDVAGKSKVFLDVEGHRLLTAGDGMEVKQPIN
jgi:spore germination protein GerM